MYDLYKMTKGGYLKEIEKSLKYSKTDLVANWGEAFKTVDCRKINLWE